jgi:AraC-like DNA-binding protein
MSLIYVFLLDGVETRMLEKYIIKRKDNTDLNVYRCGFEECSSGYAWGPAIRDHYIIHYVHSGKGTYTLCGKTYTIHPGEGFLICPNQIVAYQADQEQPWTYSWVGFHGLKADSILKKAGLSLEDPVFSYPDITLLAGRLNEMIASARHDHASDLMITGHLYLFLALLVDHRRKNQPPESKEAGGDGYISKAVEYISKNYGSRLTVGDLARFLRLDRSYFSSLFAKITGMPPLQFILRFKMEKAAELLKNSRYTIGDVARSVGYEDPLQFSKTFKKVMGLSPASYRKSSKP